ncbi:MAG: flagellar biosynthetic protein FliR [Candidatus Midichloria sp.]|uniref:Flagellar biosynthetic protein FliR n=1 Tax=Hyalomma marginatum TaxID=34627 RepID=A0A8S4BXZ3_9ACAR|nr:flagellar biosynthetic protein FliR [Hyalomma marginatum]CAG7598200.1 flagellar biosynthetic protein FliR [Hyalomma marginatum]
MKLLDISSATIFCYFVIFCRISSSLFLIPGIGEINISSRIKLTLGLAITIMIGGLQKNSIPSPANSIEMFLVIVSEITIGIALGMIAKIILSAAYTAGHAISSNMGLSTAMVFDPNHGDQGTIIGTLLGMIAVIIIINLNLHILIIESLIESYETLPIGSFFKYSESFTELIIKTVVTSWNVGIRFASPFIIISLLTYLSAGVLSRLMPQLQIFFLLLPAQVLVGFIVLMIFISSAMIWFTDEYKNFIGQLVSS